MKIKVICSTRLCFIDGVVNGEIVVSPSSILDSIWNNSIFRSKDPMIVELKRLTSKAEDFRVDQNLDSDIILRNGIVERNFLILDMYEAAKILSKYIGYYDYVESLHRAHNNKYVSEFLNFIEKCKDIEYTSQMFNIS